MAEDKENNFFNLDFTSLILRATSAFHAVEGYKYAIKIGRDSQTTVVNILRKVDPGPAVQNWLLRFDNPHKGVDYAHINIRHKYTGLPDPHLYLPPGGLVAIKIGAYFAKLMDFLRSFGNVVDAVRLGSAINKDYKLKTWDNTVQVASDITFVKIGGFIGSLIGGTIGTFIIPVIGTLVGAFCGAFAGSLYGRQLAVHFVREKETYYNAGKHYYASILMK